MAKQIKSSEIYEDDIFKNIRESAEKTIETINKINAEFKQTGEVLKKSIGGAKFDSAKSVNEFVKAQSQANKLQKEAIQLDKARIEAERQMAMATAASEKAEQQAIKTEREKLKLDQDLARQAERKAKAEEKAAKAARDESSAYKQLEKNTRELKNQSKELAAQMLVMERNGQKNSKAYRELASKYKEVTRAAQQGDAQLKKIDSTIGDNFRNVGNYKSAIGGLNKALGTIGIAFGAHQIIGFVKDTMELARVQEKAVAQVRAGLESTGGAVGYTLDELKAKASAFQQQTLFGDEQILTDLTSVMLTFTNVTGEAFDRAQQSALDLSTRMGGDLKGAAVQLGKALNDPVKGVTALQRVGVSFTEQQKEQIASLVESGKLYEAQTIILDEMNKEFAGSAKAAADADGGITQLANAWGDVKEQVGAALIEAIKPMVVGLKDFFTNLKPEQIENFVSGIGSLLKIIGKVAIAFGVYKTALLAIQAKQYLFNGGLQATITGMKNVFTASKTAADGAKSMASGVSAAGKTMSAVPWVAIIGAVIELAMAFYDVASGAAEARKQQQLTDNANRAAEKSISDLTKKTKEKADEEKRLLDIEIRKRRGKEEDKKLDEEQIKRNKEIDQQALKSLETSAKLKKAKFAEIAPLIEELARLKANINTPLNQITEARNKLIQAMPKAFRAAALSETELIDKASYYTQKLTAEIIGISKAEKEYNDLIDESNVQLEENNIKHADNTGKINAKIPKMQEYNETLDYQVKLLEDIKEESKDLFDVDETERVLRLEKERAVVLAQIAETNAQIALEKAKAGGNEEDIKKAEADLQNAQANLINAQLQLDLFDELDPAKRELLMKQAELDLLNLKTKTIETEKEIADKRMEYFRLTTEYFKKQSDERIKQYEKEISKAEEQYNTLQELAKNGNINAKESLAEQQRIINEANAKKEKEQRRQARLQLLETAFSTYNQKVASGAKNPLAETIRDIGLLRAFIDTLPAYFDGTEDTGQNGNGVDGKGGFHAILHPNERVIPKSLNDKIGDLSNEQLTKIAMEYQNGKTIRGNEQIASAFDTMLLVQKIDELNSTIKNKPETNIELGEITQSAINIVKSVKKGNTTIYNRYRIKP